MIELVALRRVEGKNREIRPECVDGLGGVCVRVIDGLGVDTLRGTIKW